MLTTGGSAQIQPNEMDSSINWFVKGPMILRAASLLMDEIVWCKFLPRHPFRTLVRFGAFQQFNDEKSGLSETQRCIAHPTSCL